jgi:hypothetical protein
MRVRRPGWQSRQQNNGINSNQPSAVRFNRVVASFAVQSSVPEVSHVERSVGRQEQLLREHFHQQTQILNSLEIKIQQVSHQMRNRPKELGYPWETGVSEDQLKVDDGLGAEYLLPTELCGTPEVISFLSSKTFTWYKIHLTQKTQS